MSGTVSQEQPVHDGQQGFPGQGGAPPGPQRGRRRHRRGWVALGITVVVAAGAVSAWQAGMFPAASSSGAGQRGAPAPATAAVTRQDLSATTPVAGTLGYAGSYTVTGQGGGTLTWLPSPGTIIRQGQVLYKTDNASPVVLLYGRVPDWRAMSAGITGQDVAQLNHDLVNLGYANSPDIIALGWDYYSWETTHGVQQLEKHRGVSYPPGSLSLGQVVFEPRALRVSQVTGHLGGPARGQVLTATSDRRQVMVPLDASQQTEVKNGDKVSITLPDGNTTPGVVSSVGHVATSSAGPSNSPGGGSGGSGSSGPATIAVHVGLTHPKAAGTLDQAPVTVNITTATARGVLAVPVSALLAQSSGGYAVEVAGPGNTRRYVPVRPGIFDDADGLVQVAGALRPGERVVVASS